MSVQSYLEKHHVFSLDEFQSELGEGRTAYNLLARATKKGGANRVVRGVYVSRAARFSREEPDPYLVAAAVASDAVMVYHSALELHGLAHSPSRRVQFMAAKATETFTYKGFEYRRYAPPKISESVQSASTTSVRRPEGVVRVTTRERTLVDCLNRTDVAGGLEEALRSLASVPYVDASNVLAYLNELASATTTARTGWLLEQRAREWYVPEDALQQMREMLGKGPYYLSRNNEAGTWVPKWRLYLPGSGAEVERWVHE
ncbi:MAG: type IV toxin-antitoxin system AbiEi family antitoxin [Coriobacteriia bacterium]